VQVTTAKDIFFSENVKRKIIKNIIGEYQEKNYKKYNFSLKMKNAVTIGPNPAHKLLSLLGVHPTFFKRPTRIRNDSAKWKGNNQEEFLKQTSQSRCIGTGLACANRGLMK
jgi:hypothetical protein